MKWRLAAMLVLGALAVACTSPEAMRTRGGGPGGDVGNRPRSVSMHEGSDPYWKTPERIEGGQRHLEASRQARDLSRSSPRQGQGE